MTLVWILCFAIVCIGAPRRKNGQVDWSHPLLFVVSLALLFGAHWLWRLIFG